MEEGKAKLDFFDRTMERLERKGVDTGDAVDVVTELEREINQYRDRIAFLEGMLPTAPSPEYMELARLKDAIVCAWVKEHRG